MSQHPDAIIKKIAMAEFYKCEVVVADGRGLLLTRLLVISKMIKTKFLKVAEISWN